MSGSLGEPKIPCEDDMLANAVSIDFLGFSQTFRVFLYMEKMNLNSCRK